MGMKSCSRKSIGLGIKWNKEITNNNTEEETEILKSISNFNKNDCKQMQRRLMSLVSFTQEDFLNTMERIKCEERFRDCEKKEMSEIVTSL